MYFKAINCHFIVTLIVALNISWSFTERVHELHHAVAVIKNQNGSIHGVIRFRENHQLKVNIRGTLEGLKKGPHGLHIHEFGDISKGCMSTGGHYDAHKTRAMHGSNAINGHTGDFGNIMVDDKGVGTLYINNSFVDLHGDKSIIGRAVLVHSEMDDLGLGKTANSIITGNVGKPLACGIVAWDD